MIYPVKSGNPARMQMAILRLQAILARAFGTPGFELRVQEGLTPGTVRTVYESSRVVGPGGAPVNPRPIAWVVDEMTALALMAAADQPVQVIRKADKTRQRMEKLSRRGNR